MNPKRESETLLNAILPLAEKMLRKFGEFYPYGGYMRPDGSIVDVGANDPDTDHPKSKDLIFVLRSSLRDLARDNRCKAAAVVLDVKITLPGSGLQSDAIQVSMDHIDGYSADVFFPYQIINNEVVYGETFAQAGTHDIFQA